MGTALVTLPDGRRARVTFESQEQLDATIDDLSSQSPAGQEQAPQSAATEAPREERGFFQKVGRAAGLAGRDIIEGLAFVPSLGADVIRGGANLVLAADDKVAELLGTRPEGYRGARFDKAPGQELKEGLTKLGLPTPENRQEEVASAIQQSLVGAGGGLKLADFLARSTAPTVAKVGEALASNRITQGAGAVTGPLASEAAKEAGAGQTGQAIAGIAGAVTPSLASAVGQTTVRGALRGGEQGRQTAERNISEFAKAGTRPSVGQATEGRLGRATESMLSRTPGGAGPIVSRAEDQAEELAAAIEKRASSLTKSSSAEQAGRTIERGVRGEGGFVDRFKLEQKNLYDKLDKFIQPSSKISVSRTEEALKQLNQTIDGAENVSRLFQNARIKGIENALKKDLQSSADEQSGLMLSPTANGQLPYEAVKKLRTLVGNEITDGLATEVPRSKFKALYAALSDDLGQAAEANPGAKQAWSRANNYTRAGMRRLEAIESVIDRSGGPEAIFRAATSGTKEGATTLRAVLQSLDTEGQKVVSATVLRRLGLAKAGVQGELGDRFSTESFLTNWNLLSTEAKGALFNRYGPGFRKDMDSIAKVAANLREGSQVFKNPSGTAQATTQAATAGAFALSVVTGQVGPAAAIAGGVAGSNLLARLMTNQDFVKWLAQSTRAPLQAIPAGINSLSRTAKERGDSDLAQAAILLSDAYEESREGQPQKE